MRGVGEAGFERGLGQGRASFYGRERMEQPTPAQISAGADPDLVAEALTQLAHR